MITARTRVAAVIGDPIAHSLSPTIHNAAFAATGFDWVFVAFAVALGQGAGAVSAMRKLGLAGLSVTTPHKDDVARAVDRLSVTAATLAAVNTVVVEGDELVGHNTDGDGLLGSLRVDLGFDPAGRCCAVRGTGGAGRAVVLALVGAGASEVIVVPGRSVANAEALAALVGGAARVGGIDEGADAELVINATSLGQAGRGSDAPAGQAFPIERFGAGQIVVDLNYPGSRLADAARGRGAVAADGVGMLVHQAGAAFTLWTGELAPLPAMAAAAASGLAARRPTS